MICGIWSGVLGAFGPGGRFCIKLFSVRSRLLDTMIGTRIRGLLKVCVTCICMFNMKETCDSCCSEVS